MRALVTGGAGFIGSALVDRLLAEGHEVDVVDDLSTGSLANLAEARTAGGKALRIHQLDIRVPEMIELVTRRRPSVVFHLAAQSSVPVSVARPMFDAEVNVLGTINVLEGARAAGSDRVVFAASGGTLYGEPDASKLPIAETVAHRPLTPYGVSKKSAIDYLVAYRELHAVEFTALALANVYGPRQDPHGESGVVAIFARHLVAAEPVSIFGDGEQTRDFVYVDDVVDAFVRASARGGGLICNVGTGKGTPINEVFRILAEAAGEDAPAEHPPMPPTRSGEVRHSSLDPARAAMQLGWQPWTTVEIGLPSTLRFFAERSANETRASERGPRPAGE